MSRNQNPSLLIHCKKTKHGLTIKHYVIVYALSNQDYSLESPGTNLKKKIELRLCTILNDVCVQSG